MTLYLISSRLNIKAIANYDIENKEFIVLEGSTVSKTVAYSKKFRGSKMIEKYRKGTIDGVKVIENVTFKSASMAANFVTGTSRNGLISWKDENGKTLKAILAEMEKK